MKLLGYMVPISISGMNSVTNFHVLHINLITMEQSRVESKLDAKKRGIESPNIADALGLTEYFYAIAQSIWRTPDKKRKKKAGEGPGKMMIYSLVLTNMAGWEYRYAFRKR